MLATTLETHQLSLFIEAIMIVLPFNEGIDASQFFRLTSKTPLVI